MVYINEEKFKSICLNSNNFYVIMDFDKTITTSNGTDSWTILQNPTIMNPQFEKDSLLLYEKYGPLELDYSLDSVNKSNYMKEWYYSVMDLTYFYGLTYDKLLDCVKSGNMPFRDGFRNFLSNLHKFNIPVIILSAGIGNVIYEALKLNNCFYDNVYIVSNVIKFEDNNMLPFNDDIIYTCNKSIDRLPSYLFEKIKNKDYILLFGDLIEDLNMVHKEDLDKTILFGFLEKNVDSNFDVYKQSFDVVLTDNSSFDDVSKILKRRLLITVFYHVS